VGHRLRIAVPLCLCLLGWAAESSAEGTAGSSLLKNASSTLQALVFDTENSRRADSLLNPGNHLAHLPDGQANAEIRLDLKTSTDYLALTLQPRCTYRRERFGGEYAQGGGDCFINQWSVKMFPIRPLSVSVGREILAWGPSNFRSPSNPFYFDNGRSNPIRELNGIDVAKATYVPALGWSFTLAHTVGVDYLNAGPANELHYRTLLKLDYNNDIYNASLNLSHRWRRELPQLGAFAQATVGSALLVYAEAGAHQGSSALYPEEQDNALAGGLSALYADSNRLFYSALLGGGYTLESGHTIYVEYLNNNEGYDRACEARYFDLSGRASEAFVSGSSSASTGARFLAAALDTKLALLGRNYLFLQFQNNQTDTGPLWQLRYSLNLADASGQASLYGEWNVMSRLALFTLGVVNHGTARSEYHAILNLSLLFGVKGYAW
jgi:hypothetical protein